ncbi:MAG: hypothetical protein ACRD6I_16195 [Candidatus Acidiferrales bacterium]
MPAKKTRAKKGAKSSTKREMKAATHRLERQLKEMKAKLGDLAVEDGEEPDDLAVRTAKDFAEQMQEINRGFREALKKAMMADGKIKPGQVLTIRDRRVFLKPRPGCPEGSMDPEHYDLTYEMLR